MTRSIPLRTAGTLLLALAAALLCVWLRIPLPWFIGPLLATAIASMLRRPTTSWAPLRNAGQCAIGLALGLYFTPQVGALVLSLWWAILLGVVWALLLGWLFSLWLQRSQGHLPGVNRATTWFASAIGAASEMTLLAERAHARTDLVAAAHSLRVLIVAVLIPLALQFSGVHGVDAASATVLRAFDPMGFLLLVLAAAAGAWSLERLGRANPWFMGPMVVAMALTLAGIELSGVPTWMSNTAQLFIGVSLGVRFTPAFVHTAPRWLGAVALGTLVMIVLSAGLGWLLSLGTGLHPATLLLGTAPGGIAEMSITAKVLQLGAPVVTVFQLCRLFAVLLLVDPLFHWQQHRRRP